MNPSVERQVVMGLEVNSSLDCVAMDILRRSRLVAQLSTHASMTLVFAYLFLRVSSVTSGSDGVSFTPNGNSGAYQQG